MINPIINNNNVKIQILILRIIVCHCEWRLKTRHSQWRLSFFFTIQKKKKKKIMCAGESGALPLHDFGGFCSFTVQCKET
jgi:hypothetical protein